MPKRLFDVVGAAAGLLAFSPIMAAITGAIVLEDGWPVLFRQERLGRGRRPFVIFKFRSMREGCITRVGRVLRATGLDELPQFLNILRGDMSAVGPRPLTAADVSRLGWMAPRFDFRWRVVPGLTGLAQVIGARSARLSLGLDRRYVSRQSLALDVRLVAVSFAIDALGKTRVRQLLERQPRPTRPRPPLAPPPAGVGTAPHPGCSVWGNRRAAVSNQAGMTFVDTALLDLTEWLCRRFQLWTGRTNVWLAFHLTNLSIVVYFVWLGALYWVTGRLMVRVFVALSFGGVFFMLARTLFRTSLDAANAQAYQRVAKGLRNPRRVRDAQLRIAFLTLSIVLVMPLWFAYTILRVRFMLYAEALVVLTTIVLYLLACDPLPPCEGKVWLWRRLPAVAAERDFM